LNLVVGQMHNATAGGDMQESIKGLRESVTKVSQRLVSPKTWLGSEDVNTLKVLCDLIDLVDQMNIQLAEHVHGPTPPPTNASAFTAASGTAKQLSGKMKPIVL
jgi:hypothetical protein